MEMYPTNTLTHYKTKLPKTIDLPGHWDIGLLEIQYPHTWNNMSEIDGFISVKNLNNGDKYVVELPTGYYKSVNVLVDHIKEKMGDVIGRTVLLSFCPITEKVTINIQGGIMVIISSYLANILGLNTEYINEKKDRKENYTGRRVASPTINALYVYCNVVEPHIIGDCFAPVLRIVPVSGENGDNVVKTYDKPHFFPLKRRAFDTIEIDIRDDTGKKIPFESGRVVVTLQLKPTPWMI